MSGLLDFVKTPEGQGLLSAVAGGLAGARRGAPVNSVGRGLLAGLAGYGNAQDREMQMAENAKQNELRGMQLDVYKQNLKTAQEKAAEEQRIKGLIASQFGPVTGTSANAATGITGPRPEAAEAIGRTPAPNYQALIAQGVPFETVKGLAEAQNLGRTKVARTVKGIGPDGREYEYQVDDFGQRVGDGLAQYRAPIQADTGGAVQFLDPYTQKPVSSLVKSMSPDARASNALGWANNAVSRERLAFDRAGGADAVNGGRPPAGYRWNVDRTALEPIPGGPATKADNATEGERKAATLLQRMDGSLKQLQAVTSKNPGAATPNVLAETARSLPFIGGDTPANAVMSSDRQRVEAAQLDILDAALTLGTGAAYTKEQLEGYRRSYFPQLMDSEAQIRDKQERLNNVLQAARIAAGRAAPASAAPQAPKASGGDPLKGFRIVEVN